MKGKITDRLKSPLTKRPSEVGHWKLNEMPGSSEYLRQNNRRKLWQKWERRVSNRWNHTKGGLLLMVESCELWTLKLKLWASQIWTLINNFVIVLICAKCSKFIILEENLISVQQLPLCLPLFFAFSSEVLNSGIKICFDVVIFQDAVCEEYL